MGKEEPKEEWEICRSTTGDNKPSDRDEDVFSSSDNRDLWVRVRNGERGKSAYMNPQVKLHYCIRNSYCCAKQDVIQFN